MDVLRRKSDSGAKSCAALADAVVSRRSFGGLATRLTHRIGIKVEGGLRERPGSPETLTWEAGATAHRFSFDRALFDHSHARVLRRTLARLPAAFQERPRCRNRPRCNLPGARRQRDRRGPEFLRFPPRLASRPRSSVPRQRRVSPPQGDICGEPDGLGGARVSRFLARPDIGGGTMPKAGRSAHGATCPGCDFVGRASAWQGGTCWMSG